MLEVLALMNRLRSTLRSTLLPVCLILGACTSPTLSPASSGQLSFRVQRPESIQSFGIKLIPTTATSLRVTVSITGSSKPELSQDLPLTQQASTHTLSLSTGSKQIEVLAFDAQGETVARAQQNVEILPGRTTRAELDLGPVSPSPQPSATAPNLPTPGSTPNSAPTSNPTNPGQSASPAAPQNPEPSVEPSVQASSQPSPQSTPFPSSGGGGGGSSSGGSASSIILNSLSADPTTLAGAGFVSELTASFSGGTPSSSQLSWSCLDAIGQSCSAPVPGTTGSNAFWTAPSNGNSPFTLKLIYLPGDGSQQTQTVSVSVVYGSSGPLTTGPGVIDGGETGGI